MSNLQSHTGDSESPKAIERVLALDLSSRTGWALYDDGKLTKFGVIESDGNALTSSGVRYPWSLLTNILQMRENIRLLLEETHPNCVVIEETNLGKQRYSQKYLEWLHFAVVAYLDVLCKEDELHHQKVYYISTSSWRRTLGLTLSKADVKNNRKVRKIKTDSVLSAGVKKQLLKELGARGKVTQKHLSCRYVKETHGITLKVSTENDIADAICLGDAYLRGAAVCSGAED